WKPPAHSPEENMVRQKCSGIRRSYLVVKLGLVALAFYLLLGSTIDWSSWKTYAAMLIFGAFL
ncbi:hypothetical protein QU892_17145, partial [Citrobacter freundii]